MGLEGWGVGGVIFFDEKSRFKCAQKMYIRQCVPQGSHLTTLPISFYLLPVPLVNAVLQPTEGGGQQDALLGGSRAEIA